MKTKDIEELRQAFDEALRMTKLLNFNLHFNFKGITCYCSNKGNTDKGIENYKKSIERKLNYTYNL